MNSKNTTHDYVCLMDVNPGDFSLNYQGRIFSFCSKQCRDRFEYNPHLYIGNAGHPAAKQLGKQIIKRRVLKLDQVIPIESRATLINELKAMMGIIDVTINNDLITIIYDLLEVTTQQIENTIETSGNSLGAGWGNKLKLAFLHYLEETQLDNLEYDNSTHGHHHH